MRQITLVIHHEEGTWWAESSELPGFSAAAESLEELRREATDGIAFHLDDEPFVVSETMSDADQPKVWWRVFSTDGFSEAMGRARASVVVGSASPEPVAL